MKKVDHILEEIEILISKGETEKAIEETKSLLKNQVPSLYKEALVLSNLYYEQKKNYLLDIVKEKESSSKIIISLIDLIEKAKLKINTNSQAQRNNSDPNNHTKNLLFTPPYSQQKKENTFSKYRLASKRERFIAALLEAIIFFTLAMVIATLSGQDISQILEESSKRQTSIGDVITHIIFAGILGMFFYPIFSGNLGHKILGLKVISTTTGKSFNSFYEGFSRELLKALMGYLVLPLLWLFFDNKKQNLYDKITRTIVVKKDRS